MTSVSSGFLSSFSSSVLNSNSNNSNNNNSNNNINNGNNMTGGFGLSGVAPSTSGTGTWSSSGGGTRYYEGEPAQQQSQQQQQQQQNSTPMDFSSLLSASSSLMKHSNTILVGCGVRHRSGALSGGLPPPKKSLREIGIASHALAAGGGGGGSTSASVRMNNSAAAAAAASSTTFAQEASAHRLLAREGGGFDSAKLGRSARDLEVHASHHHHHSHYAPPSHLYATGGAGVSEVADGSGNNVSSYLQSAHTNLVSSLLERPNMSSIIQERMLDHWKTERSRAVASIIGTRTLKSSSSSHHPAVPPPAPFRLVNSTPFVHRNGGGLTMELMQQHLECLLQNSMSHDHWQSLERRPNTAYASAIRFVSLFHKPQQLTFYLAQQYQNQLSNRVQSAALQGRLVSTFSTDGLAQDIQHYASMELGLATSHHSTQDVLWRCIYYCLRCGDFQAISQIIHSTPNHGLDPAVLTILQELSSITNLNDVHQLLSQSSCRHVLKELYVRAKTRNRNATATNNNNNFTTTNQHQVVCLALLSLAEPCHTNHMIVQTIEDYIYVSLWFASKDTQQQEIANLGALVQQWGPSHFDQNDTLTTTTAANNTTTTHTTNHWAYAMPLLLCHQFESALTHLAQTDLGLLQATHLALILHQQGISLHDLTSSTTDNSKSFDLIQSLLVAYASKLQTKSPEAALEYLIYIPDNDTPQIPRPNNNNNNNNNNNSEPKNISKAAQQQICRLLMETKDYSILAGNVTVDGSRDCAGAMDKHLSKSVVSTILAQAAEDTFREGNVVDAAELLALAGHYSSLMSLLNRQLASLLCVATPDNNSNETNNTDVEKRAFWKNAALNFFNSHISGGRTHVLQVLEKEDTMELGNTFQLLLNLMVFFDRCHEKEWQSAWELLDSLDLIPKMESQMSLKVESFYPLASEVKQMFHHVVLKAMESLYFQYETIKSEGRNQSICSASANQQRLTELRSRARLLVTFAGLIHLNCSTDIKARFTRMEAFMM